MAMSYDVTNENEVSRGGPGTENRPPDADRHISPTLAHELNNVLTLVQGHAEFLFMKHQTDTALAPHLKRIAEAARRAAELVRHAPKCDLNPPTAG